VVGGDHDAGGATGETVVGGLDWAGKGIAETEDPTLAVDAVVAVIRGNQGEASGHGRARMR